MNSDDFRRFVEDLQIARLRVKFIPSTRSDGRLLLQIEGVDFFFTADGQYDGSGASLDDPPRVADRN